MFFSFSQMCFVELRIVIVSLYIFMLFGLN